MIPAVPELVNQYTLKDSISFYEKYGNPKYALTDVFLKADVVPSAGKLLADLKNKQMTYFVKIITGSNNADFYDEFIKEWRSQGGEQLEKEAQEIEGVKAEIIKKVNSK